MGFITFDIIIMKLIKLNKKCKLIIIIIKYDLLILYCLHIYIKHYVIPHKCKAVFQIMSFKVSIC